MGTTRLSSSTVLSFCLARTRRPQNLIFFDRQRWRPPVATLAAAVLFSGLLPTPVAWPRFPWTCPASPCEKIPAITRIKHVTKAVGAPFFLIPPSLCRGHDQSGRNMRHIERCTREKERRRTGKQKESKRAITGVPRIWSSMCDARLYIPRSVAPPNPIDGSSILLLAEN